MAGCSTAISASVLRNVLGWRFQSFMREPWRKNLISSCVKSFSRRYGPCSRTTTLKPAVASSLAITPPAAPDLITTKSTVSERNRAILLLEPDQFPASLVPVPAVLGAPQECHHCVHPQRLEEL